jgi:hypothetical protein
VYDAFGDFIVLQRIYDMTQTAQFLMAIHRNPWRPPHALQKMREEMLRSVVHHAYTHTTFYRRLYQSHGIKPSDIQSLEDIVKLPIVSKQSLRACSISKLAMKATLQGQRASHFGFIPSPEPSIISEHYMQDGSSSTDISLGILS